MAANLANEEKMEKIIKKIIAQDEGIAAADRAFRRICSGEVQPVRLPTLQKSEVNYQRRLVEAKRRDHAESLQKGRAEASLEIARKMKNAGRPLSEIEEFTGLSIEKINE